jgi:signal peptidase I
LAVILGMTAIGAWAFMTERVAYVVTDGVSMNPVYYQGDLVLVIKENSYQVGQIAAYHGSSPGQRVLHRIIGGDSATGFVLKGDNNESIDPLKPTSDKLIGRAVLHIPKGGLWLKPLFGPTGLGMLGFLIFGGVTGEPRNRREVPRGRRKKRVKTMSRQGGPWAVAVAVAKAIKHMSPLLRTITGLVAVAALAGLTLGVLGWMKPVTKLQKPDAGAAQSMTFTYSAKVPKSPAYDTTMVTSPEPIFRKLAQRVDVQMRYSGHPGAFDAYLTMSDGRGWHTSSELAASKDFSGRSYIGTVTLDLSRSRTAPPRPRRRSASRRRRCRSR